MTALTAPVSLSSNSSQHRDHAQSQLFQVETDFSLEGKKQSLELQISLNGLRLVENDTGSVLTTLHWSQIESFRTVAGVGSGILQVKTDSVWTDLLRFSNRLATRFHKVARTLERMREVVETKPDEGTDANELVDEAVELPIDRDAALRDIANELTRDPLDPPRCNACSLRLQTVDESCPRCMEKGQILRHILHLLLPHKRGAIFLCILTIVGVVAELIPPKLQQYMVDHILNGPTVEGVSNGSSVPFQSALLIVVLALAFSRILMSVVSVIKGQIATRIGTELTGTLRLELVQKLQRMAVAYYDRHQVGSMISRVAHDSEVLHGLMHQLTGGFLLQTAQLVGVGAMLMWLNPKLAMFTLIPVPLVFVGSWIFWQKVYPRYYRLWDASSRQMSILGGMLQGIRVVKSFAQEDREYERFRKTSDHLRQWRLWVENTNAWYSASMSIVFSLGGLIVWYVGGRDVIGKEMSLGELIAFLAYLAMFYAPLGALSNFTSWLTSFLSGSKRVLELMETPLGVQDPAHAKKWDNPCGHLRFDHVTFGYDRNQPVIKDVSFEVAPGEMVGIVGRSGSGKSTMVNLLGRFYDVQEGAVLVDGIDVRNLSMQSLRENLGIVFQDSFLFRGTIWKNLSYGRPQSTIEQALVAAKAAGAHDFILRQSLGYETLLGEHGAGLSGGEKQRLSIARTLLYDPKVLILDEATSNIDAEAERSIQEALEVLVRGRTTIAIAHRLSTLRNADRILVFDRGRMIEHGTHAELLSADGTYARLVRIQTQVSKDPNVDKLLWNAENPKPNSVVDGKAEKNNEGEAEPDAAKQKAAAIHWLEPHRTELRLGKLHRTEVWIDGECVADSVFAVASFPATQPDRYLSLRRWKDHGEDEEIGMISNLSEWSAEQQSLLTSMTSRRYLLRKIQKVTQVKLRLGFLEFDVVTDLGREVFSMRWTQSQAIDFGERGKLLMDTEENRYVVPDIEALPAADRERFLQYVYW
jgi:ATP-binding cassette, subfamily B, bacterial